MSSNVSKALLREVYLLFLALLCFLAFFFPAMIQAASRPTRPKIDRLWVRVVSDSPVSLSREVGVLVELERVGRPTMASTLEESEEAEWVHCGSFSTLSLEKGDRLLRARVWLSQIPLAASGEPVPLTGPVRVLFYMDSQANAVEEALGNGAISVAPASSCLVEVVLPDALHQWVDLREVK